VPESQINLDGRVEEVYPFGVPLVIQPVAKLNELDTLFERAYGGPEDAGAEFTPNEVLGIIYREVLATGRSIRNSRGPSTVLHALILQDQLSLGQIAGIVHQDPRDLEMQVRALASLGWVREDDRNGLTKYSLTGLGDS
jgi:hypothetical protein